MQQRLDSCARQMLRGGRSWILPQLPPPKHAAIANGERGRFGQYWENSLRNAARWRGVQRSLLQLKPSKPGSALVPGKRGLSAAMQPPHKWREATVKCFNKDEALTAQESGERRLPPSSGVLWLSRTCVAAVGEA